MAEGSSNPERACDRCRERRVKCDKTRPTCLRCQKLGKSCPGYAKKRKFVDEGVLLRKKFEPDSIASTQDEVKFANPSNQPSAFRTTSQKSHSSWSTTFEAAETVTARPTLRQADAATLPPRLEHHNSALSIESIHPNSIYSNDETVDQLIGEIMSEQTFDPAWFDLDPADFYGTGGNSCGFLPEAPNIVDEIDKGDEIFKVSQPIQSLETPPETDSFENDWHIWATESQLHTSLRISDEREHEMAFLIRYFSESIGPWMDLFDCERHFTQLVPLKALQDVLLKNAIAAVAAKQLGCIKGSRPSMSQNQKPASMELIDGEEDIDWFYKAANYYDKAIMCSRAYLAALTGTASAPPSPSLSASLAVAESDDLLLAVSIFSLYEYLDNADLGWIQHLTGLRSILNVINPPILHSNPLNHIALGRKASFWNFARADYQAAYINKTTTLLDTNNRSVWLDSGLQIQPNGALYSDTEALKHARGVLCSTNQLVAHTLLWILLQTMNFLFTQYNSSTERLATWQRISSKLDSWQAARPSAFQPCAQVSHRFPKSRMNRQNASRNVINELFFSIPVCAATVQLYHFARLLLLLNKPDSGPSPSSVNSTNGRGEDEEQDIMVHAYTIIGIALGRPQPAVRVEMLLPLCLAGSCLKHDDERQVVVDTMMAIGKDTGCVAGGRIKELTNAWSWPAKQQLVV